MLVQAGVKVAVRLEDERVRADFPVLESADADSAALTAGSSVGARQSPVISDAAVVDHQIVHTHAHIGEGSHESASNFGDGLAPHCGAVIIDAEGSIRGEEGGHSRRILATPCSGVTPCEVR